MIFLFLFQKKDMKLCLIERFTRVLRNNSSHLTLKTVVSCCFVKNYYAFCTGKKYLHKRMNNFKTMSRKYGIIEKYSFC